MDMEPFLETAERQNEVHKGRNSGTDDCEVTKEKKEEKQYNMRGAQFAIKIIYRYKKVYKVFNLPQSACMGRNLSRQECPKQTPPGKCRGSSPAQSPQHIHTLGQ